MKPMLAVAPITPSKEALARNAAMLGRIGWAVRLALKPWLAGVEVVGREHVLDGPSLILANHSHFLDPLIMTLFLRRPIQFMVTEPAMFDSPLARFLARFGQVPKRKLESDVKSMRLLKQWCAVGGSVCVFPEGQFSYDARLGPLRGGLAQLIDYLDVPVVTLRQMNGDRFWPIWAPRPRRTSLRIEVDAPRRFAPSEDVYAEVAKRLQVDPDHCVRFPVSGRHLARGLARLFRYCPSCFAETLSERGDALVCSACSELWRVGSDNVLKGKSDTSVGAALARICAELDRRWDKNPVLESAGLVELFDTTALAWRSIGRARLILRDGTFSLGEWTLAANSILGHSFDWGDLIQVRTKTQRFALRLDFDSRALWTHAIERAK
jgi:1-acyl-sn-glycerol-3-phosphate acyltransferase